jgi:glycosyltransferase involved in cell wall biosynthesis
MLISVVIPTRHRNKALAECLQRLAPGVQTLPADGYEVIVTDDGSVTTAEVLVRERFPWARWTAGPRRGPAANRNHGASVARGDCLAFTDDDCLPSPGWLAAFAAAMFHGTGGFDERFPHAWVEDVEFHTRVVQAGLTVRFVPDAVVDHPPRRRRLGVAAGRLWEGRVLLATLDPPTLPQPLPVHVAKWRIGQLMTAGVSGQSLRFAWSSLVEWAVVVASWRRWTARYAGAKRLVPERSVLARSGRGV